MPTARTPPASIFILAYDQCDELDVVGPYAMLQTPHLLTTFGRQPPVQDYTLRVVALDGSGAITAQGPDGPLYFVKGIHGTTLGVEPWDGAEPPDILIVAGGNIGKDAGIRRQMTNTAFTGAIARQHAAGKQVVSLCTGVLGLGAAGILGGRRITGHPGVLNELVTYGANVVNPDWRARVVDDGDVITAGGVTSGIDEGLYLVQAFWPNDPQLESDVRDFVDFRYQSTIIGPP
jgi:DJ-1/PfpI family